MTDIQADLLDAVRHAPSLMNTQPWKVSFGDAEMSLRLDPSRLLPSLDPDSRGAWIGLGCAAENACLTLEHAGFDATCRVDGVVVVSWLPRHDPPPDPTLYRMIPLRRTSRLPLVHAVAAHPASLMLAASIVADQRRAVRASSLAMLSDPAKAREAYRWIRYLPGHHSDGLTADTLALRPWEGRIAACLMHPLLPAWFRRLLLDDVPQAPAWGRLDADVPTPTGWFEAGRRFQRLWLEATAVGLSLHPLFVPLDPPGCLLFRLGVSPPVPASPRLPADELLE